MNHPPEWTEEQVAAALADLLDQPQPTTDNPALQPYLETFQQLHALSEAPQEFFQKDLAWLIIGQQLQQPKKVNLRPWLARLRSALTVSWRPSPRLALGLTVIIIAIGAWLFWPINPPQTLPQPQNFPEGYVVMESRSMAMSFYEPANRFEILTTLGIQGLSDFEAYQYRLSQEQSQPAKTLARTHPRGEPPRALLQARGARALVTVQP